jgi:acyl transferase domain-containing protein
MVVDTACSSSLVAVHLAVQALRRGECDLALAGGVHLMLAPNVSVALSRARMMSPDGCCKAFDASANGFGQGEGGGMVVLKRLSDAETAGDRILAVIAGSALNQDGRSAGITAPNQRAQVGVIRAALADAGLMPESIDAIEAHGTGTSLGDPVELHALAAVFAGRTRPLPVGSVKASIGHTAAAAGVAGLIKAILMLRHGAVPATPHFRTLNPHVDLAGVPIEVETALRPVADMGAVGISSFGFSGTNAHIVVRRAPTSSPAAPPTGGQHLVISARTEDALRALIAAYQKAFARSELSFADACATAARGRARLPWWVNVTGPEELASAVPSQARLASPESANGAVVDLPIYPFQRRRFPRTTLAASEPAPAFPGKLIVSPSADRQLDCVLDVTAQPWLVDHRVHGRVVVPGAVMIALMLAAAPDGTTALAHIAFLEPVLLDDAPVRIAAIARPDGTVGVATQSGEDWTWHATARVERPSSPLAMADAPADGASMNREAWVAHLAALGIDIGPVFQGIDRIATGGISRARLNSAMLGAAVGGAFHPALLDAALQVAGGTLPAEPVLPIGITKLSLHGPLAQADEVVARCIDDRIDLIVQAKGVPVASIEGLQVRRLSEAMPPIVAALTWVPLPATATTAPSETFEVACGGTNLAAALDLLQHRPPTSPRITFVARNAADDPAASGFAGLASAVAEERPETGCRFVDIASGTPDALLSAELAAAGEPIVALRPEGRFVPRLAPIARQSSQVRLSGTVLITGGLGGIGLHTARWAMARGAEALVLVGRSGGTAPADLPAHVLALDITAPDAVDALRTVLAGLPPLTTIAHVAGVLRDGLLDNLSVDDFSRVRAPKLDGAKTLHDLTAHHPVEHFLLFSSIASLIGAAGQASYAAANASLDAFAVWRRARGLPATSIAWGRWSNTGFAATLSIAQTARVTARGLLAMTPERALAALDTAILSQAPVVMVAALDPLRLAENAPPVFANFVPAPVPVDGSVAEQIAGMVQQVLGQPAPAGEPLINLGLDSLMATDLRNRVNRRFGTGLGLALLMGGADVNGLVAAVESSLADGDAVEELVI